METYNTVFDEISITFMDQNGRSLNVEDKVNLTLLKSKGYGFLSFARKYKK